MKKYLSFLCLFITIACLPVTAFMASLNCEGEPDMLNPKHIVGAFIWQDHDGFHLRTTTTGDQHVFTGNIHTNGHFEDINDISDRSFKGTDYYHIKDRDTIEFQFTTNGKKVGLDFNIDTGDYAAFELYIDGHKISPMEVYIGKDGWHPDDYKFTLDRLTHYNDEYNKVVIIHDGWWQGVGWDGPEWDRPRWHHHW